MTQSKPTEATTSQTEFWNVNRDSYLVDPAFRNETTGHLNYPVPESNANRWVIVREIQDDNDPHELPSPVLIGEFEAREVAERICRLITVAPKLLTAAKATFTVLELILEVDGPEACTQIELEAEPLATLRAAIIEAESAGEAA